MDLKVHILCFKQKTNIIEYISCLGFLMPHHEMAEGHIESYLCVYDHLCFPESCLARNFVLHGGI